MAESPPPLCNRVSAVRIHLCYKGFLLAPRDYTTSLFIIYPNGYRFTSIQHASSKTVYLFHFASKQHEGYLHSFVTRFIMDFQPINSQINSLTLTLQYQYAHQLAKLQETRLYYHRPQPLLVASSHLAIENPISICYHPLPFL